MQCDYLIIGAGTAGCVMASRLSEDPGRTVMLMETGPRDRHPLIRIPAAFSKLYKSGVDYAHYSTAQAELNGRSLFIPRGKTLGGSGAINAMIYIRGHRDDFDGWAAMGNPGWSYDELLPLFRKSERSLSTDTHLHGRDGCWNIQTPADIHPLSRIFLSAAEESGYPIEPDLNSNVRHGVGVHPVNILNGARHSPAHAFLSPAMSRPNLRVLTGHSALRARWDGSRVVGVEAAKGRRTIEIRVESEVILSAGAIQSPLFLMRSGIGSPQILREMGVNVRCDRRGVGQNLQDHPVVPIAYRTRAGASLDGQDTLGNLLRWWWRREGPLCSNLCETGGFTCTEPRLGAPDLQFHFAPVFFVDHGFVRPPGNGMSLAPILVAPLSRGTVRPAPNAPLTPLIDPAVYSNRLDLDRMVLGFHKARAIMEAAAFDEWRLEPFLPAGQLATDAQIEAYLRSHTELLYHPVGTCRMGGGDEAVVDTQLRVHGVDGLRVVDASIMPTITRGNTQAPTVVIAEKAAQLITQ